MILFVRDGGAETTSATPAPRASLLDGPVTDMLATDFLV